MKIAPAAMTCLALLVFPQARGQSANFSPEAASGALEDGFKSEDYTQLHKVLRQWQKASNPTSPEVLAKKPAFEQAVYALYEPFFTHDFGSGKSEYLIVQSAVNVYLVEEDLDGAYRKKSRTLGWMTGNLASISQFTIHSFQPRVAIEGKKVLYFKRPYVTALVQFLTGKNVGIEDVWREPNGLDEHDVRSKRLAYLNSSLRIIPGHWERGWHFATHPEITGIVLSTKLDRAVVYFRTGYRGGQVLLHLQEKTWAVVEKEWTWVE